MLLFIGLKLCLLIFSAWLLFVIVFDRFLMHFYWLVQCLQQAGQRARGDDARRMITVDCTALYQNMDKYHIIIQLTPLYIYTYIYIHIYIYICMYVLFFCFTVFYCVFAMFYYMFTFVYYMFIYFYYVLQYLTITLYKQL